MIESGTPVSGDVAALVERHDLAFPEAHTDLDETACVCRRVVSRPPVTSGNTCATCGGMTVQTGTCHTCIECGTSGGCG